MQKGFIRSISITLLLGIVLSVVAIPAQAQSVSSARQSSENAPQLLIQAQDNDIVFEWSISSGAEVVSASMAEVALQSIPQMEYGGYMLPMQLQTVVLRDDTPLRQLSIAQGASAQAVLGIEVQAIHSVPLRSALQMAEPEKPKALDWEETPRVNQEVTALPTEPAFILREGRIRGTRVAVVAFSPIYSDGDDVKVAHDFSVRLANADLLEGTLTDLMEPNQAAVQAASIQFEDTASTSLVYEPINPAAARDAIKIHVTSSGMQFVTGSQLINNGVNPGTPLSNIQIAHRGTEVAVEMWDSGENGTLDASDSIRFYAAHAENTMGVGDYWNEETIYWLTDYGSNGLRMTPRNVIPTGTNGVTIRPIAFERGIWEDNEVYQSTMPGPDGDNWFHAAMEVTPEQDGDPASYPTLTINLSNKLPLASSSMVSRFTLTGSSETVANHTLQVGLGATSVITSWTNRQYFDSWSHTISSTVSHPESLQLTLIPGSLPSKVFIDKVQWEQPVLLDFGGSGAAFTGVSGTWLYQLANVSTDAALYDVTDASRPQRLLIPGGSSPQFEDGPDQRDYILATPTDMHNPQVSKHVGVTWPTSMRAHGVYIGYNYFHDELEPLLTMRRQQGYEVLAVDLQSVYDSWNFGEVSPNAVRNMLQYAVNNWSLGPASAVAVGDSTVDPKNYGGRMNGNANKNIFPTFLESKDPWLGETTCEPCFAQLDDPNPLDGILDKDFLIDMWFGRFSVQDESQLSDIVAKIVSYESNDDRGLDAKWRQQSIFIADNYVRADCTIDSAGDFAKSSDDIISRFQSPTIDSTRIYYDPSTEVDSDCKYFSSQAKPGRYAQPDLLRQAVDEAYQGGAGLITFDGHSNHFQNGRTEQNKGYIMGFNDILKMKNTDRLPIILEMTCYTGQFTYVSTTGTTMDERFQRHPDGGAAALFVPSGLSVATGHKFLQEGLHEYLWGHPAYTSRMGELIEAGYSSLFEKSTCCQDVRFTFLLLGDPLTTALVIAPQETHLPLVFK